MANKICGYTIHSRPKNFLPSTILFSNEQENITVEMAKTALDYIVGQIARRSPILETYKKAKTVYEALKMILENKTPKHFSKEDAKIAVDVLEEIKNENARSENEKLYNSQMAFWCKLVIDGVRV